MCMCVRVEIGFFLSEGKIGRYMCGFDLDFFTRLLYFLRILSTIILVLYQSGVTELIIFIFLKLFFFNR